MSVKFSDLDIASRRDKVSEAASEVFLRYGFGKTTMGDIADAASLSRPALYTLFARKEDVFAAVVHRLSEEKLNEMRAQLSKLRSLDRKIHLCCESWGVHGVELTARHPDARDLFNLSFPSVQKMYSDFIEFLEELLKPAVDAAALRLTAKSLARNLVYGMRGFKEVARDSDHMREMISLEVTLVLNALRVSSV